MLPLIIHLVMLVVEVIQEECTSSQTAVYGKIQSFTSLSFTIVYLRVIDEEIQPYRRKQTVVYDLHVQSPCIVTVFAPL